MPRTTDWIQLWQELVEAQSAGKPHESKLKESHRATTRRWAKPDSTQEFILSQLKAAPGSTVLDIGAGMGSWAVLLSPYVRQVTAVESDPAMVQAMRENLATSGVGNVEIIHGAWPAVEVTPHDFTLCSHGMYGSPDLPSFIQAMERATRQVCFLILRAPAPDGVMAEAALRIWGHPYDSPNFQVCYNALLQMGIFANVMVARNGLWSSWKNSSLEEAMVEIKRRFGIVGPSEHDEFLAELLRRRLTFEEGQYVWPRSVRSALVYWNTNRKSE